VKKRRLFIAILGCVVVAAITLLLWPREREPEYDGAPLSKWLERYIKSADGLQTNENLRAIRAIQHMGTNAFPFLLRWIQYETPGWRNFLNSLARRLPSSVKNIRALRWLIDDKAEHRADLSAEVFWLLRWTQDEVNELRRLAKSPVARKTQSRAMFALWNMSEYLKPNDFDASMVY
jgi:hypothetical protein